MESIILLTGVTFIVTFVTLYIWSIIWSYKDATLRGKNGIAVATLVALFAWPFGLLFWTVIRPENVKSKAKLLKSSLKVSEPNKYVDNFKAMPFLLKLLLIASIYSLITTLFDFMQMKPISFEYFNSGFPKNYPFIWYVYYLLFNVATIVVYFKRSYSVLMKYLYVSLGILILSVFSTTYSVINLPAEQRSATAIVYIVTYIFAGLIYVYQLQQKKYFHLS